MSVDLSGAQIIVGVFTCLLLCLGFFVRLWISRLQTDIDSVKKKHEEKATEFHLYQLQCARDFAQKSEISNGRLEMMEAMHKIEAKVDRIFDKLDKKADKQ
ncbi:hypothetical protein [Undibacterium sp. Ren11W]|uniref:hypothetical protein n=1 Tax=Undibacterium sp. Ren11W TaxID=3413045 RepID=UPI003BF3D5D1